MCIRARGGNGTRKQKSRISTIVERFTLTNSHVEHVARKYRTEVGTSLFTIVGNLCVRFSGLPCWQDVVGSVRDR